MPNVLPRAIPFSFPGIPGVRCLFSTARAGDMSLSGKGAPRAEAVANRHAFMREAGFSRWAEVHQVHGDLIVPAAGAAAVDGRFETKADGQFAFEAGTALIIKTADCQPILFARKDGKAIAALHVGWRGNARNLPGAAVARLCGEFACAPADLLAVRGPSLGPEWSEFVNFAAEWPAEFAPWYNPTGKTVDLWALTRHQLERAGLPPENIFSIDMCTRDMAGSFFSHRRNDAERQIGAIWIA